MSAQVVHLQGLTAFPLANNLKLGIVTRLLDRYFLDAFSKRHVFLRALL
jgi:hypothetical protein